MVVHHLCHFLPRRGNILVVSICLSVQAITFEQIDQESSFLVWCYNLTVSGSSLSIKFIGSTSRSYTGNDNLTTYMSGAPHL